MPRASGQKFHYQDYDSDVANEAPPVQNTWYEVFDAINVRLLLCRVRQINDEVAAKDVEVRWTIDGNVYLGVFTCLDTTWYYVWRTPTPSGAGTGGLSLTTTPSTATLYTDKRGLTFKVEVRMTSVPGTNQVLRCECVRETLELT